MRVSPQDTFNTKTVLVCLKSYHVKLTTKCQSELQIYKCAIYEMRSLFQAVLRQGVHWIVKVTNNLVP